MKRKGFALLLFGCVAGAQAGTLTLDAELRAIKRNPELFVDLNRPAVVKLIANKWQAEFGDTEAAMQALQQLRGDQLYRASIANTFAEVMSAAAETAVQKSKPLQKALGDTTSDFTYTPVTPCRLVETRGTFAAVYQGGGPFAPGEVRTYTLQGGNGVCLSQLPAGVNPTAVVLSVFGIPTTAGSGDIEILPQGSAFGSTTTEVFLGNNAFTSAGTIAQANSNNSQIGVQVRISPAHVAIDVVGYFKRAVGNPSALLRTSSAPTVVQGSSGVTATDVNAPSCPLGKIMVSGGCSVITGNDPTFLSLAASDADQTNSHWTCTFVNFSANNESVIASTFCIDTPSRAQ